MESMQRIVHLDFKACPFKVEYFEKILHLFKSWGVTGILIEWEDTFPYSNKLAKVGSQSTGPSDGMYSVEEVHSIFNMASSIGLEIIQLIQTFAHLEYVLKHPQFEHLREVELCPSVLCPASDEAQELISTMLQQALELQPDAKFIHFGGDDVWHTSVCEDCEDVAGIKGRPTALELYMRHVRLVAASIKAIRPNLRILMWDDMIRLAPLDLLKAYDICTIIEPVVTDYNMEVLEVDSGLWERYSTMFPTVWAGSVFKGSASSQQIVVPIERYVSNHVAWVKTFNKNNMHVNFSGIILTGWSRFDHFATICELLPLALPCLALCMRTLMTNGTQVSYKVESLPPISWPGQPLVDAVKQYDVLREKCLTLIRGDLVGAWLNPWQISHAYTNPLQVEGVAITAHEYLLELEDLEPIVNGCFLEITGPRTTAEWIGTNITGLIDQIKGMYTIANERANSQPGVYPVKH